MRRVRLTDQVLHDDGTTVEVPRTDVWALPKSASGYVFNRKGICTARYSDDYKSLGLRFIPQNRREALRLAEEWVAELRNAGKVRARGPILQQTPTFGWAWVRYERDQLERSATSPRERRRYQGADRAYKVFVGDRHGLHLTDETARELTTAGLAVLRPLHSPSSLASYAGHWSQFLRYCRASGWMSTDPVALVRLPRRANPKAVVYSSDELQRLYQWAAHRDQHLELLWRFLVGTSCRIHEALALRWSDIHPTHINFRVTKGDRPRPFPLSKFPEVSEVLTRLQQLPTGSHLFPWARSGYHKEGNDPLVYLVEALRELGIEGGSRPTHRFRKTGLLLWRQRGIGAELRARLAGHSVEQALGVYDAEVTAAELERLLP